MKTIKDYNGNKIDFEAAVMLMDDEIREQLHGTGIEDEQDFYNAYCKNITRSTTKNLKSKPKRAQAPVHARRPILDIDRLVNRLELVYKVVETL